MNRPVVRTSCSIIALAALILSGAEYATATTNCVFVTAPKTMTLQGPCSTDETIVIPNNMTLNGQGFKITAIDPPGGFFQGPILRNGGKTAHITNLFIRTNLQDVCNDEASKVIGILIDRNAAGPTGTVSSNISSVNITMNKADGTSTCSEGVAIQAQALPYGPQKPFSKVTVKYSTLNYNQLAGVVALGNINLRVESNLIKNLDGFPVAQRGIEIANGAKSYLLLNEILRHRNSVLVDNPSYGIFLNAASQSTVLSNTLNYNDTAIRVSGGTKITVKANYVRSSTLYGIQVDDANGIPAVQNTIWGNDSGKNGLHGIFLQSVNGMVTKNVLKSNLTERNDQTGITVDTVASGVFVNGTKNKIQLNTTGLNDTTDIVNLGAGGIFSRNVCTTSTGAPVDCPVAGGS